MPPISRFARGLLHPLRRDGKGNFANASGQEKIRNNLILILSTRAASERVPGEVAQRPEFGSWLHLLLFEPLTERTIALAQFYVVDALGRWEPRVEVIRSNIEGIEDSSGNTLSISVTYQPIEAQEGVEASETVTIAI